MGSGHPALLKEARRFLSPLGRLCVADEQTPPLCPGKARSMGPTCIPLCPACSTRQRVASGRARGMSMVPVGVQGPGADGSARRGLLCTGCRGPGSEERRRCGSCLSPASPPGLEGGLDPRPCGLCCPQANRRPHRV